jgi:hypothetical protein
MDCPDRENQTLCAKDGTDRWDSYQPKRICLTDSEELFRTEILSFLQHTRQIENKVQQPRLLFKWQPANYFTSVMKTVVKMQNFHTDFLIKESPELKISIENFRGGIEGCPGC